MTLIWGPKSREMVFVGEVSFMKEAKPLSYMQKERLKPLGVDFSNACYLKGLVSIPFLNLVEIDNYFTYTEFTMIEPILCKIEELHLNVQIALTNSTDPILQYLQAQSWWLRQLGLLCTPFKLPQLPNPIYYIDKISVAVGKYIYYLHTARLAR